jgi:hypothetical protein
MGQPATSQSQAGVAELASWLTQLERMTAAIYGSLDLPVTQLRLETLNKLKIRVEGNLDALNKMLRAHTDAERAAVVEPQLSALLAIKLVRDDLYLVSLELIRAQRKPGDSSDQTQATLLGEYDGFLQNWIATSPLIDPDTVKWFWPNVKNAKNAPGLREFIEDRHPPDSVVAPIELARTAIKQESSQLASDPKTVALSRRTTHLIGIAFILAQVELALRFANDGSYQQLVHEWYNAAKRPAAIISELLGCLDQPIREAIRDNNPAVTSKLEPARRALLAVLALNYSLPARECATLVGFYKGADKPTEIVGVNNVTEKVRLRPGLIREDRTQGREMLGYMANTGFPLIYPQRNASDPLHPPLRRGRIARLITSRATREYVELEEQAAFSLAETVTEQSELIADLLALKTVRNTFAAALKKQPTLDLVDRASRGRVFAAAIRALAAKATPEEALRTLIPLIQRYLSYFTRHTGDNMRDSGTPYLSSPWPTDLNGRQFFDCGIYAVETAFDLMRAANAIKGLTLEFRFLVFPEHVCLVVYAGQTSFAANNGHIYLPQPLPTGTLAKPKDAAGFSWATLAMQDAFSARFAIVIVALHPKTISSRQSDAAFRTAIWTMYLKITGLGINPGVGKAYFDSAKAFDLGSTLLTGYLLELTDTTGKPASNAERTESLNRGADLAANLYELAKAIADQCNYQDSQGVGFLTVIGSNVSLDNADLLAKLNHQLPMYEFVRQLQTPGLNLSPAQQQLANRSTGQKHLDELTKALTSANCNAKTVQTLAATHLTLQAETAKLVKDPPPRILERLKAAGSPLR